MRTLRSIIALMLAVPLVASSASIAPDEAQASRSGLEAVGEGGTSQDGCCWIYYLGEWYCVPC